MVRRTYRLPLASTLVRRSTRASFGDPGRERLHRGAPGTGFHERRGRAARDWFIATCIGHAPLHFRQLRRAQGLLFDARGSFG